MNFRRYISNLNFQKGMLQEGYPYAVHRVAQYADDLHKDSSILNRRMLCGIYIISSSLSVRTLDCSELVKVLSIIHSDEEQTIFLRGNINT